MGKGGVGCEDRPSLVIHGSRPPPTIPTGTRTKWNQSDAQRHECGGNTTLSLRVGDRRRLRAWCAWCRRCTARALGKRGSGRRNRGVGVIKVGSNGRAISEGRQRRSLIGAANVLAQRPVGPTGSTHGWPRSVAPRIVPDGGLPIKTCCASVRSFLAFGGQTLESPA